MMAKYRKTYEMRVCEPHFTHIKNGKKYVEGRLKKGKWSKIEAYDQVAIVDPVSGERITRVLKFKVTCKNFRELYFLYNDRFLPGVEPQADAETICHSYYSSEAIETNEVVGLIFEMDFTNYLLLANKLFSV